MKYILAILLTIFLYGTGYAQQDKDLRSYAQSIQKSIFALNADQLACVATIGFIKVDIDKQGAIDIRFSDSIDTIFTIELRKSFATWDPTPLRNYLKKNGQTTGQFLIPLSYSVISNRCQKLSFDITLLRTLNKFDGKLISGEFIVSEPIGLEVVSQDN